jgi:hypothetical protein
MSHRPMRHSADELDSHNPDFDFEPVMGLPELLPKGEQLLWQGAPDPWSMAIDIMHLRHVGGAFAVMALWWGAAGWHDGESFSMIATTVGATVLAAALALGILAISGLMMARGTVYSLTSRRLVIRHGVAMPMAINIPFSKVDSAALSEKPNGMGNVAFTPHARSRTSYVALWPHVRPWQMLRPEPMLRCIPDSASVAHLVAQALVADASRVTSAAAPMQAGSGTSVTAVARQSDKPRAIRSPLGSAMKGSAQRATAGSAKSPVLS